MNAYTSQPILISCGEYSGDILAADLIDVLNQHQIKQGLSPLNFFGVTGPQLKKRGVQNIADMNSLTMMGVFEIIERGYHISVIEDLLLQEAKRLGTKLAILTDFPGFHIRIGQKLRSMGIFVIQYIAPKIWAWGEYRKHAIQKSFDVILGIFPFEIEYFHLLKIPYIYAGFTHAHRLNQVMPLLVAPPEFTQVCMLLGSRTSEIKRLHSSFKQIIALAALSNLKWKFVIPVAKNQPYKDTCELMLGGLTELEQSMIIFKHGYSLDIMKASRVAIVASGTATLECAYLQTPQIAVYAMNPLTFWLAKKIVKIKHVSLPNILAGREIIPEYLQDLKPQVLLENLIELSKDRGSRQQQLGHLKDLRLTLTQNEDIPHILEDLFS